MLARPNIQIKMLTISNDSLILSHYRGILTSIYGKTDVEVDWFIKDLNKKR